MNKPFPIYYEAFGNAHHPCIILIPGIGGQLTVWPKILIDGLVANGFFVMALDHRDAGLSHYYDELGVPNFNQAMAAIHQGQFHPPYTLEDMAADVIALMDELSIEKAHIVGMSMGGVIAQYVALNDTDRVLSLICIATTSGDRNLPEAKKEVSDFFSSSMTASNESFETAINKKLELFKIYNHPDYFDEAKAKAEIIAAFKRAHHPDGFKRLLLAMISATPRTELLKKLHLPCLIIHGDYDPVFSIEHGKQLAESIPGSHLEILHKMGHGLPDYFALKIVDLIVFYTNQQQSK